MTNTINSCNYNNNSISIIYTYMCWKSIININILKRIFEDTKKLLILVPTNKWNIVPVANLGCGNRSSHNNYAECLLIILPNSCILCHNTLLLIAYYYAQYNELLLPHNHLNKVLNTLFSYIIWQVPLLRNLPTTHSCITHRLRWAYR